MLTRANKKLLSIAVVFYPLFLIGYLFAAIDMSKVMDFLLIPKYYTGVILALLILVILWKKNLKNVVRIHLLYVAFFLFGGASVFFMPHPSPVCITTKPFLMGLLPGFVAGIIVIFGLSLIATKGFCGTICHGGALQEIMYRIPILKSFKRKHKLNFAITNSFRALLFTSFVIVALAWGIHIIEYVNFFEIFHYNFELETFDLVLILSVTGIVLFASLFYFRPYCYTVCPVGFLTWLFEQISLQRVRFEKEKCDSCNICLTESPCPAIKDIINQKTIRADCHLCGTCLQSCTRDALSFGVGRNKKTADSPNS